MDNTIQDTINNFLWSNLPYDLLILIFNKLRYGDLKATRLVCKHWRVPTQLPEFIKKSILIINPYNIDILYDMIQQNNEFSQRFAYDNVALHDLQISDKLRLILKFLGPRIHKLRLHNSPVTDILNDYLPELEELILSEIPLIGSETLESANPNNLKCLKSLDINCYYEFDAIKNHMILNLTRQPTLKFEKLCINVFCKDQTFVINFLQFHSQSLKHLEIDFGRESPDGEWIEAFALLEHLEVLKFNGNLRKVWLQEVIHALPSRAPLRYFCFDTFELFDWTKVFTTKWPTLLTNIAVVCADRQFYENMKVSAHLWHTVRSLCFQSVFNDISHGRYVTFVLEPPCDINKMNEMLQCFNRVTHLSIDVADALTNDNTLSLIFGHLLQLQHLYIKDCDNITDQGLLGYGSNPAPITNLKCLQSLILRRFIDITDLPLRECFKFNELRTLELTFSKNITCEGIKEMVKNCPVLEDLTLTYGDGVDDDCIFHIAQGLPRLRRLDVSNCTRLTKKSLQHIVNYCKSLKELAIRYIYMNESKEWEQILRKKMYVYGGNIF